MDLSVTHEEAQKGIATVVAVMTAELEQGSEQIKDIERLFDDLTKRELAIAFVYTTHALFSALGYTNADIPNTIKAWGMNAAEGKVYP